MTDRATKYWDYIKVEQILALQTGLGEHESEICNDEVMFIVIHQVEELWLKLALRELIVARDLFAQPYVPDTTLASAARGIERTTEILKHAASHLSLMETMTTRDYLGFRDKLFPASGFQSAQLREIEIIMGLSMDDRIPLGHETYLQALQNPDGSPSPALRRVEARLNDLPTLLTAIEDWLYRTPIEGSLPSDDGDENAVADFVDRYAAAHRREAETFRDRASELARTDADRNRVRERYDREATSARIHFMAEDVDPADRRRRVRIRTALLFIESYREHPLLAWPRAIVDALVALEQAFVMFRQRHARMVERMIGRRTGTGGSAGVEYLDRTALEYRVFRELWATRTLLIREGALPNIVHADVYSFAFERKNVD